MTARVRLYQWHSQALRSYGSGVILAVGRNPAEARANARAGFDTLAREMKSWCFVESSDEDDAKELKEFFDQLEADIREDAKISLAAFVSGSQ